MDTLNWHAPLGPNVTKTLRKAIMRRSDLQIKFFETSKPEPLKKDKEHKKYCGRLYKSLRKMFFNNLKVTNITDNKAFFGKI